MNRSLSARLSVMMFLQYFIWGAWYTVIAVYMANNGMGDLTHWPFTVNPIAAIIAPFFLGLIADRYFDSEKVFGVLHILGGIVMFIVPMTTANAALFIGLLLLYNLFYMPTISLGNTVAFHHITNQEKEFPIIRVFGTIGWIVAGLMISFVLVYFAADVPERTALPLQMAAAASILLGLYSFSLPHTPPPAKGEKVSVRSIFGIDAFKTLGSKPFYVFLASSVLICIPLAAYYNFTQLFLESAGFENIAGTQTIGQMSEVIFMLLMPFFFVRLGVKWMLAVGMGAWVLRYALFAAGAPDAVVWMIIGGIALHGIAYDFFFVTGQIYVDKKATAKVRGQAQGLIVLATYGVGLAIGAQIAGNIYNRFLAGREALPLADWMGFWIWPSALAGLILIFFVIFFKDKVLADDKAPDVAEGDVGKAATIDAGP
ncbi:MAG: MFS transporter [Bacteroidota bacterium]